MSGELMRISCIDFIKNCSYAKIEVKDHCLGKSLLIYVFIEIFLVFNFVFSIHHMDPLLAAKVIF